MADASTRRLRVHLLGEVTAYAGDDELALGPRRQRAVLVLLAMRANHTVSRSELIDGVWGDAAPASAEGSVHTYIHVLRRALSPAGKDVLAWTGTGYQLALGPGDLDVDLVEAQLRRARERASAGDRSAAADLIGECLTLWRGVPLFGLPGPFIETARMRLTELRYELIEERADLMLASGRHREVISELGEAIPGEPFRERLRAQLMLALYRSGRQADALAEFDTTRRLFIDELGLEPSESLVDLHLRILRSDPRLDSTIEPEPRTLSAVPAQLPRAVPDFVGRADELQRMTDWCAEAQSNGQALLISAIDGAGGIGKTSLAVRFARQVAEEYPDGQLHLDLRGFDPNQPPLTPSDALGRLLWALGSPSQRPEVDLQSSTYRSLLSGKRMLILLDNAVSSEQVRDLLPGEPNCLVLITSRNRLGGLVARDGARRLTLGLLTEAEALELLRRAIGHQRIDDEAAEAAELVRLCGYLPLALRVAAEKISAKQDSSLRDLVDNLSAERSRLDTLDAGDDEMSSVRGVFSWSYRSLQPDSARTFRHLGLLRGPDIGVLAASALIDKPASETQHLLEQLTDQHLLEKAENRFGLHDLIKVYSGELVVREESQEERATAMLRLLEWYHQSLVAANLCISPGYSPVAAIAKEIAYDLPRFDARESVLAWCKIEAPNILALTQYAASIGEYEISWQLPWLMAFHYYSTGLLTEWIEILTIGLSSSERLPDPEPRARMLMVLSIANSRIGKNDAAVDYLERALSLVRGTDKLDLIAGLLANLASTLREMKEYRQGIRYAQEAYELAMKAKSDYHIAGALDSLCELYVESRQPEKALLYTDIGLKAARAIGAPLNEANLLVNLAHAHRDLGDTEAATRGYRTALDILEKVGNRYHQALALMGLAELHRREARYDQAMEQAQRALDIFVLLDGEEAQVARTFITALATEGAPSHDRG
ncbi:AfsR/SARP family transcriptional regulator [Amycolatopsis thailandensis]|uniref:AfsR/SARP family transcriptional regulator n=1 Tax=Amycolatopsis thailandensis TaxID=589330 RepID=UPI00363398A2